MGLTVCVCVLLLVINAHRTALMTWAQDLSKSYSGHVMATMTESIMPGSYVSWKNRVSR